MNQEIARVRAMPTSDLPSTGQTTSINAADVRILLVFLFFLLFGFYLILLFPGAIRQNGFLTDADTYWHVKVGETIWRTGTLPTIDEYSHTFRGHPWIAKEWLSQLLLFGGYATAGWRGAVLLAASSVAFTYAFLFRTLAHKMRIAVAIGVATLAFAFSSGHFHARPHIFANLVTIIWVASLVSSVDDRKSPNFWLLPLMTLWANLHGSFIFGLGIGTALALEAIWGAETGARYRVAGRWASFLIAALGFGLITPYFYQPLLMAYQVTAGSDVANSIQEWQPVKLNSLGFHETLLFSLLFLALYYGVKLPFWRLLTLMAIIFMMFKHIRFSTYFAMLAPILLASPLTEQFPFLRLSTQLKTQSKIVITAARVARRALYPYIALLCVGMVVFVAYGPNLVPPPRISPAGAVDFIERQHLRGKIYNSYGFGGYLIFRGIPTFIDGRAEQLFLTHDFAKAIQDALTKRRGEFDAFLADRNVSIALVTPGSAEAQELLRSKDWEKVYSDDVSVLFRKRQP
jgi:hypothetical protein